MAPLALGEHAEEAALSASGQTCRPQVTKPLLLEVADGEFLEWCGLVVSERRPPASGCVDSPLPGLHFAATQAPAASGTRLTLQPAQAVLPAGLSLAGRRVLSARGKGMRVRARSICTQLSPIAACGWRAGEQGRVAQKGDPRQHAPCVPAAQVSEIDVGALPWPPQAWALAGAPGWGRKGQAQLPRSAGSWRAARLWLARLTMPSRRPGLTRGAVRRCAALCALSDCPGSTCFGRRARATPRCSRCSTRLGRARWRRAQPMRW